MNFTRGIHSFMLIVLAFALIFGVLAIASTVRLQFKLREQPGLSRSDFIAAMPEGAAEIAEDVFDEYRREFYGSGFRLSPQCDLKRVYAQESEDIFDIAKQIAARRGSRPPTESDLCTIDATESFTARNLVELLISLKK
jgi:hypothetical protein